MTYTNKVLLIYTGGTIGMNRNPRTGALEPFNFETLLNNVPELQQVPTEINTYQFNPPIDSSDMSPERWIDIAHVIANNYNSYNGFVILHGTDTMAYTASALSYMLENLTKPVILTGSQLPRKTSLRASRLPRPSIRMARQLCPRCAFTSTVTLCEATAPQSRAPTISTPSRVSTTATWPMRVSTSTSTRGAS